MDPNTQRRGALPCDSGNVRRLKMISVKMGHDHVGDLPPRGAQDPQRLRGVNSAIYQYRAVDQQGRGAAGILIKAILAIGLQTLGKIRGTGAEKL